MSEPYLFKEAVCPECGKEFIVPTDNVYHLVVDGKKRHFCSYSCFRAVQKRKEAKRKRSTRVL